MAWLWVPSFITIATLLSNHVTMETVSPIHLNYHIFEEINPGTSIGHLKEDANLIDKYTSDELSQLQFGFLMQPTARIALDTNTGDLVTSGRLDREEYCESEEKCELHIDVVVQPVHYFQIIKISLVIEDLNDNEPEFEESHVSLQILESIATGKSISLPQAYDLDSPEYGIRSYELLGSLNHFRLQADKKLDGTTALKLIIEQKLDREEFSEYHLELIAIDHGGLAGTSEIFIQILDANDNNPVFQNNSYDVTVTENIAIGSTILRVQADDPDAGPNGEIVYTFTTRTREKYGDVLLLDPLMGDIIVVDTLDYEVHPVLHLAIIAEDGGSNTLPAEALVVVTVLDVNDNAPDVTVNTLTGSDVAEVTENSPIGTFVAHLSVEDGDSGQNGAFECFLRHAAFSLSKLYDTEYQVVTTLVLDRETMAKYDVTIECIDDGKTRLATVTILSIVVTDANDNAPEFLETSYHVSIRENNPVGRSLLQVRAIDRDTGANSFVTYSISHEAASFFNIDPETGKISAAISYDREQNDVLNFFVIATDSGTPSLSSSTNVYITLIDINDETPRFLEDGYSFAVPESEPVLTTVGQVAAVDRDSPPFSKIQYSIESNVDFQIDSNTGVIKTSRQLDREVTAIYHLLVIARDVSSPHHSSSSSVTVYVSDINDNAPFFEFPNVFNNTVQVPNNAPSDYAVSRIRARDLDFGKNAQLHYSIIEGNEKGYFKLDENHGILITAVDISLLDIKSLKFKILVRDLGSAPLSKTAILNIQIVQPMTLNSNGAPNGLLSSDNFTIVISLGVISLAITIILIVIIIFIYKRNQHRKQYGTYNCRKEALRIWQNNATRVTDERTLTNSDMFGMTGSSMMGGSTINCTTGKKEVSFNLDIESVIEKRPESQQSLRSTIDSHALRNPQAQSSALTAATSLSTFADTATLQGHMTSSVTNLHAEQRQLEVERLMDMLRRGEYETNSIISEEDSTTDSGRGASEEGDHAHLHNDTLVEKKKMRHYSKDSPDPQVVPSISNQTTPTSIHSKQLSLLPSHKLSHLPTHLTNHSPGSPQKDIQNHTPLSTFKGQNARLQCDSAGSVAESEILDDTKNTQLECAFIQSATPGTPTATWRNTDYSPSSFYASYLDYKCPTKSSQLLVHAETIDIENSPKPLVNENVQRCQRGNYVTISPQNHSYYQKKLNNSAKKVVNPQFTTNSSPNAKQDENKNVDLSQFNDTECTENGIFYATADMSDVLSSQSPDRSVHHSRLNTSQTPDRNSRRSPSKTPDRTSNLSVCKTPDRKTVLSHNTQNESQSVTPDRQNESECVENCSSTSGSYVVDPQDLCDEIDRIFFNESEA